MYKACTVVLVLALTACSTAKESKQIANDVNSPAAPAESVSGDAGFMLKALAAGTREYKRGTLEVESKDTYVRSYANMVVTDHGTANNELIALARTHNVTVPNESQPGAESSGSPAPQAHGAIEAEQALAQHPLTPSAYFHTEVDGHTQMIALFKAEAQSGASTDVRDFARKSLPMLQKHLDAARKNMSIERSLHH